MMKKLGNAINMLNKRLPVNGFPTDFLFLFGSRLFIFSLVDVTDRCREYVDKLGMLTWILKNPRLWKK